MTTAIQTPLFSVDVPENGAARGHVRIVSQSVAISDVALFGFCSSVISSLLYEKMQAGGTNIVLTMAKDGVRIDIIARKEDDGIDLQWPLKPGDPAQLDAIQERIRAKTFFVKPDVVPAKKQNAPPGEKQEAALAVVDSSVKTSAPVSTPPAVQAAGHVATQSADDEEREDYLTKQLHRIP